MVSKPMGETLSMKNLDLSFGDILCIELLHNIIKDGEYWGALKQGPCTCNTFKVFNLMYVHVLRS